jgi:hypothetical protein
VKTRLSGSSEVDYERPSLTKAFHQSAAASRRAFRDGWEAYSGSPSTHPQDHARDKDSTIGQGLATGRN